MEHRVTGCSRCYPARYFGNMEGLEGLETKGFWTAASAHVLRLPSIVVQVFKVLASLEKYIKIPENYFRKIRCFPKDTACFRAVSGGRKLPRKFPERTRSFQVSRVRRACGKYLRAAERCGWAMSHPSTPACMTTLAPQNIATKNPPSARTAVAGF